MPVVPLVKSVWLSSVALRKEAGKERRTKHGQVRRRDRLSLPQRALGNGLDSGLEVDPALSKPVVFWETYLKDGRDTDGGSNLLEALSRREIADERLCSRRDRAELEICWMRRSVRGPS